MDLVTDKSEQDVQRHYAAQHMAYVARELAANLIRVVRGAGRPAHLGAQCADFLATAEQYRDAHGVWPVEELNRWLSVRSTYEERDRFPDDERNRMLAIDCIIAGALQTSASRMLKQRTQEAAGEKELSNGIRGYEATSEQRRERWSKEAAGISFSRVLAATKPKTTSTRKPSRSKK